MPGTTLHLPSSVLTGGVALPRRAESEVMREQAQMVQEMEFVTGRLRYYEDLAKQIDEHLRIVLAKPNTTVEGLKPNYYHVIRLRPGHPAWIKPYEGPNGEWLDLDEGIIEMIKDRDLWNDRTQREIRQRQRRADEALQRDKQRKAQDRAREFDERWKSLNNVSISVPRSI